ncbi:MAG TPA: sigma-70 family RNA polymerase sigma factor [Candidatus Hydrogenedentes bacterium]|nr:sigma-70 family RNA polymerase sigma factor [Candidatus Hydrogenedentota bacterium]HQM51405.1 sigma-70 family RNA polymerase sigma factor [Candidatus Hydrogenedentota bacterium]
MNRISRRMYSTNGTKDATAFDEAEALVKARKGDRAAFGALVKAYERRAYAVAYGFVHNRDDALELAQEAFARAYKAMPRFKTELPFYPWLYRIIKNTCINHLKKRRRRGETSLDGLLESGFDVAHAAENPVDDAQLGDLRTAIAAAMTRLSREHREILMMRHFQDLPYAEIAECLEIPKGTVMSRLHAARRALRNALGGAPE